MKVIWTILPIGFIASCNSASTKIASADSGLRAVAPEMSETAVYAGTLPCGDCEGIDVSLQLNPDASYFMNSVYKGSRVDSNRNSFKDTGTWTMHGADTLILSQRRIAVKYIKTDSTLTQLDGNSNIITGPLADMFILHKK